MKFSDKLEKSITECKCWEVLGIYDLKNNTGKMELVIAKNEDEALMKLEMFTGQKFVKHNVREVQYLNWYKDYIR